LQVDRAVVLAAGLGTRLKWLTRHCPKALVEVADQPMIAHVLRQLVSQGVRDVAVNAHYHADQLIQALGDGSRFGLRIHISHEDVLLDSGGGVATALPVLPGTGLFAVHNVDVLADVDLSRLAAFCPSGGGCLALVENPSHRPQGDFDLAGHRIVRTRKKEHRYTYAGVAVFDALAFESYSQGDIFPLMTVLQSLIDRELLFGVVHRGGWLDIGRPRDLIRARKLIGGAG